ncbi:hypothetical protein D3C87_1411070 [compost metagenome]
MPPSSLPTARISTCRALPSSFLSRSDSAEVSAPSVISSRVPGDFSAASRRLAWSIAAPTSLPGLPIRSVLSAWMNVSSKAGSSVGGSTRWALPAYAISALRAPARRRIKSCSLCFTASSRDGCTSLASMEGDRSMAKISGARFSRKSGRSCSQVGPAAAIAPNTSRAQTRCTGRSQC